MASVLVASTKFGFMTVLVAVTAGDPATMSTFLRRVILFCAVVASPPGIVMHARGSSATISPVNRVPLAIISMSISPMLRWMSICDVMPSFDHQVHVGGQSPGPLTAEMQTIFQQVPIIYVAICEFERGVIVQECCVRF